MNYVSLHEVEYIAVRLAQKLMNWDEPIPDFTTRLPHLLEQCLAAPRATFGRRPLYSGLIGQAAIMFYTMIKNHPFQNGNKRIAVMTLLYFLYQNGAWLVIDNQELYNFATWVAASNPKVKDQTVAATAAIIKQNLVRRASR